jgi:hypothetical protein
MFFGLFKKEEKKSRVPKYDSKLIDKFLSDHKKLVQRIGDIQKSIDTKNIKKAKQHLNQLRMEMLGHFMEEDIRLYWYLKDFYKDEKSVLTIVNTFESSIKTIQKDVMNFLEYYAKDETALDAEFIQKFEDIVKKLDARLQSEETSLYSLYNK